MIIDIITDALVKVGFDPAYVLVGTQREVNQLLHTLPLQAPPDGIDILANIDLLFNGTTNFRQFGGTDDDMQMRVLFFKKNPGDQDCLQIDRFTRAMEMLVYAKRFVLAANQDKRTYRAGGWIQSVSWEAVYHAFDADLDGILLTITIPVNEPVTAVC